jgi:hypothetical protein
MIIPISFLLELLEIANKNGEVDRVKLIEGYIDDIRRAEKCI